ncbi:Putative membrane protein [Ignavibacterium album JCM 16511]|uniref:Putative membrane protein n=1 Tax=Ignavibacterium album (strain DSM 19864 / JCM 16511 / NBRC 101810 / Mat9-16) TaxID=945713 RepID=I0AFS1_IGNAJ|nr:DoxX family protein [Ignavibacterium album]AFH47828.1 Putative membrane protein [Ignavibacterium album JCM 16511]
MKRLNIFYWVFTGLLIPSLGYGSIMELMGNPQSIEIITSLGYPAYLSPFLGVARILALIAIFTPKFPRLKEWAYAGLVFDVIGATYSQIAVGNPLTYTIFPIIILGIIFGSYYFHHKRLTINS